MDTAHYDVRLEIEEEEDECVYLADTNYYIVCYDPPRDPGERGHWWDAFTIKGFGHVIVVHAVNDEVVKVIDGTLSSFSVEAFLGKPMDFIAGTLRDEGVQGPIHWVRVPEELCFGHDFDKGGFSWPMLSLYCVSTAKHYLGIRPFAYRPHTLFEHFVRKGCDNGCID